MSNLSLRFKLFASDPTLCSDVILSDLEAATGNEVVDASNAFVLLMEMSTHLASQNLISEQLGLKKRYASLATDFADIYPHLSPPDIHSLFAKPTSTQLRVSILIESILSTAVNVGTYREVIIPKYTEIHVDDIVFSVSRQISIKIYNNRVFKVSYVDTGGIHADIAILNGNNTYTRQDGTLWLTFVIDVQQVNYQEYTFSALSGLSFDELVPYTDQLSSVSISYWSGGKYIDLPMVLTNRVYDPLTPMAIIVPNIEKKTLSVFIPSMYTSTAVTGNIKIVVGTTRGDIDRVFTHYGPSDYLLNLDTSLYQTTAAETAFLNASSIYEIITPLSGGRDALTKEEVRARVIDRSLGHRERPISRGEMTSLLNDNGLSLVLYQEGIGGRTYVVLDDTPHPTVNGQVPIPFDYAAYNDLSGPLLTLPSPSDDYIYKLAKYQTHVGKRSRVVPYDSQLPIGMLTFTTHYDQLVLMPNVKKFTTGITITPETLFIASGTAVFPTNVTVAEIDLLSTDTKINTLNMNPYVFSLLYYSICPNNGEWNITPWVLNTPSCQISDRVDADASIANIFSRIGEEVIKTDAGYVLKIYCTNIAATNVYTHSDTSVFIRIQSPSVFFPGTSSNQGDMLILEVTSYIEGESMVYEVEIASSFQLVGEYIGLTDNLLTYFINGSMWIDVVYCLKTKPVGYVGELASLLSDTTLGVMLHERLYTTFGEPLPNLWVNSHGIGDKVRYQTYDADEPYTVTTNSLHETVAESIPFEFDDSCNIVYKPTTLTEKVVTVNNQTVYKHRKGDLVLDILGRPIPINTDYQQLAFDMLCVDARAVYCTDTTIVDQLDLIVRDIAYKSTTAIDNILPRMLERTTLLYRPVRTLGESIVLTNNKSVGTIALSVRPVVSLGVTSEVYNDSAARRHLHDLTVQTLNLSLRRQTISYDHILLDLRTVYGTSVISVKVSNLPEIIYSTPVSLNDVTTQCVVDVQLTQSPNGPLTLSDYIVVQYNIVA